MSKPTAAVLEIASYVSFRLHLSTGTQTRMAGCLQEMVDQGRLVGMVGTGDHDEDGKTVRDWDWLSVPRDGDLIEVIAEWLQKKMDPTYEDGKVVYQDDAVELLAYIAAATRK